MGRGKGNFRATGIFFRHQIPCNNLGRYSLVGPVGMDTQNMTDPANENRFGWFLVNRVFPARLI